MFYWPPTEPFSCLSFIHLILSISLLIVQRVPWMFAIAWSCCILQLSIYSKCLTGGWVESLKVPHVSPSLRWHHLIKRGKFSKEDTARMWSLSPIFRTVLVLVPPTASPLPSSPLSLRTIPQAQQTPFVHPSLHSNRFLRPHPPSLHGKVEAGQG